MLHKQNSVISLSNGYKGILLLLFSILFFISKSVLANIAISSSNLAFADIDVGSSSTPRSITLVNTSSTYRVSIFSIDVSGDFDYTTNCGDSIAPSSNCTVDVTFSPQTYGDRTGTLIITGDDPSSNAVTPPSTPPASASRAFSYTATLSGTGLLAEISIPSAEIDFGSVAVNDQSDVIEFPISNSGNAPLSISSISATEPFSQTNDCPDTLDGGAGCSIFVSTSPVDSGDINGSLVINGSKQTGAFQQIIPLHVSGIAAAISVSPSNLSFPQTVAGSQSDSMTVTLANQDDVPISLLSIDIEGDFTQSNDCPAQLMSHGDSCEIQVVFSPETAGTSTGNLLITTDFGTNSIPLTGNAEASGNPVADLLAPYTGGNPNLGALAEVIGEACPSGRLTDRLQEDCNDVVGGAINGDPNTGSALSQVAPEAATKANNSSQQGGQAQIRNLGSRIAALRAGASGISFQGLDLLIDDKNFSINTIAKAYKQSGGGASSDNPLMENRLGFFITGDISTGSKDESDLESGLDFDTYGLTMGLDYRINQNFILGGALGYVNTATELEDDAAEIDTQGYSLNLYGTYYAEQNYFIDFSLGYGANNFEQYRRINYQLDGLANVDQKLTADYDGSMVSLFVGSGYDFAYGPWSFGPRADLEYHKSDVDGFTEQVSNPTADGGGWATRVDDSDQTWLTLKLGGRLAYTHSADWGILIPYTRLDWLHEFKDDAQVFSAYFVGDPDAQAIRIESEDPDRDYLRLRLGTSAQFKNGLVGFIDYGTILAHSDWTAHTISVGLRTEF
ncbi:MAG: autotransporter domain-containing protein [Candidatus Thiodiazotropha sp.]